jgi:hypothetical protein
MAVNGGEGENDGGDELNLGFESAAQGQLGLGKTAARVAAPPL